MFLPTMVSVYEPLRDRGITLTLLLEHCQGDGTPNKRARASTATPTRPSLSPVPTHVPPTATTPATATTATAAPTLADEDRIAAADLGEQPRISEAVTESTSATKVATNTSAPEAMSVGAADAASALDEEGDVVAEGETAPTKGKGGNSAETLAEIVGEAGAGTLSEGTEEEEDTDLDDDR